MTRGRRFQRVVAVGLVALSVTLALLSNPAVSQILIASLQVYPPLDDTDIAELSSGPATAIVVLSAGRRLQAPEFGGETVDELSLERIRYGAALARQTRLPVLVTGGPARAGEPAVAQLMGDALARDYGLSPKWIETRASNTAENAIFSTEMLKQDGIKRVLLVTHAWHMKRARAAFAANGLGVVPAPTAFYGGAGPNSWEDLLPSIHSLRMSGYAVHEIVGGAWYALRYGY
jgi:uncharacterized SAM-binding protein YcdF (DUF218 family)